MRIWSDLAVPLEPGFDLFLKLKILKRKDLLPMIF